MLNKQQLITWFTSNGVDINLPIPSPLMDRLFRKAVSTDTALFVFLGKSCFTSYKKELLILNFKSWEELFECYNSYSTVFQISRA